MKKALTLIATAATVVLLAACSNNASSTSSNSGTASTTQVSTSGKSVLFINASQNADGNTAKMGSTLLDGVDHDTLNLVDYRINQLGQHFDGDQFNDVVVAMEKADTIVIGTPVYWHTCLLAHHEWFTQDPHRPFL